MSTNCCGGLHGGDRRRGARVDPLLDRRRAARGRGPARRSSTSTSALTPVAAAARCGQPAGHRLGRRDEALLLGGAVVLGHLAALAAGQLRPRRTAG